MVHSLKEKPFQRISRSVLVKVGHARGAQPSWRGDINLCKTVLQAYTTVGFRTVHEI